MTQLELNEIVDQKMRDPQISGCIVSNVRGDRTTEQRHRDQSKLGIAWHDCGDFLRCTIMANDDLRRPVAQVDLQENATVRIETFQPCRVTISHEEGFLCLSR